MTGSDALDSDLAVCLKRMAAGDLTARDTIIELLGERLRRLAHRMIARFPGVRRWEETDDLFQNAALRLHRSLGQMRLTEPRSVLAMAATELQRELLDLARKHAGPHSDAANHATGLVPGSDDTAAGRLRVEVAGGSDEPLDRWAAFHAAIEDLEPTQREVFRMVWYLGCDQKTVAAALGCSERTVKSRWRDAREAVRSRMGGESPA